jgi:hypothetical protein
MALRQVKHAFPASALVGCSSAGSMLGHSLVDNALCVTVTRLDSSSLQRVEAELPEGGLDDAATTSAAVGRALARQLAARSGLRAVLIWADGLAIDGCALSEAMTTELSPDVLLTGALAADAGQFRATWVLAHDGPKRARVVALGLFGTRLRVHHGIGSGFALLGPPRRITKANGSVLQTLDGRPALDTYRAYLGARAHSLPAAALHFPVQLHVDGKEPVVRTVLGIDEDSGAIRFAGGMPEGSTVTLLRCSREQLLTSAEEAMHVALAGCPSPALVNVVSCIGRRLVFGTRAEDEVDGLARQLPTGAVLQGCYSFGEVAPVAAGCSARLHNQSVCVTALGEAT